MKRRIVTILLVVLMLVVMLPTTAFAGSKNLTINIVTLDVNGNVTTETGGKVDSDTWLFGAYWKVKATSYSGYYFKEWSGDITNSSTENPNYVKRDGDKTVTAYFQKLPEYTLSLSVEGNGHLNNSGLAGTYSGGDTVNLMDAGPWPNDIGHYYFAGWRDDANPSAGLLKPAVYIPRTQTYLGPVNITMDSNKSYTAVFKGFKYDLTAEARSNGELTVNINGEYEYGTTVDLNTAGPQGTTEGYEFKYWEEKVGSWPNYSWVRTDSVITVGVLNEYRAVFGIAEYDITFDLGGHGSWLDGTTANKVVPTEYDSTPQAPDVVEDTGWIFTGWSPTIVAATGEATYVAQYSQEQYDITFSIGDHGSWTDGTTDSDRVVQTAHGATPQAPGITADTGWEFTGWDPEIVSATGEATYVAQYERETYDITFSIGDHGSWTDGTTDSDRVVPTAYEATPQDPDVTADTGWKFTGWSPTIVAATGEATYVAQYEREQYDITFSIGDHGSWTDGTTDSDRVVPTAYEATPQAPDVTADTGWEFTGLVSDDRGGNRRNDVCGTV